MLILVALVATAFAEQPLTVDELLTQPIPEMAQHLEGEALVDYVNKRQNSFTAEYSPNAERYIMDRIMDSSYLDDPTEGIPMKVFDAKEEEPLPESFDARQKWKDCPSIDYIRDQSACASGGCWAVAAAEVMSDRACIQSKGKFKKHLSDTDILACCPDCGAGCNGGSSLKGWNYVIKEGVVTGGRYGDEGCCKPYAFHPCGKHANQTYYGECPLQHRTPICYKACHPYYTTPYDQDKIYGGTVYSLPNDEKAIRREIMTNGPVVASFRIYSDFIYYRKGIYVHTSGRERGGHAVKLVGWGKENGVDYWLIANSYNFDWGENGYFRMPRGSNHCKIEEKVVAGTMKV